MKEWLIEMMKKFISNCCQKRIVTLTPQMQLNDNCIESRFIFWCKVLKRT